jgi:hypothetical protein
MKLFFLVLLLLFLIVPVSATTVTFNATHDGIPWDNDPAQTWTLKHSATGDVVDNDMADYMTLGDWASSGAGTYSQFSRPILTFNASTIPDDATITGAIVSVYAESHDTGLGNLAISLIDSTPANPMNIAAGDYDGTTFTRMANSDLTYAAFSNSNPNNWTLNAAGLTKISKTNTPFSFMLASANDTDNIEPAWSSSTRFRTLFYSRAHASGTKQPFITINYTAAVAFNVTADSVGTTWIRWTWGPGYNISGMWVDGYSVCGYDTLATYVDIVDLTSCVNHTIMVNTTTSDSATNTTMTTCGTSDSGIKVVEDVPLPTEIIICSLCLSFIILGVRRK